MDIMIDLETLGINPDCPVISIGAAAFNETGIKETFEVNLDTTHQIDIMSRKVTADTIKWWMSQEDAAKKVFKEATVHPEVGLKALVDWITAIKKKYKVKRIHPWGNGSTFDISIMENLLSQYNVKIPWEFYNIMDFRTFKRFVYDGKDMSFQGVKHNALEDAKHQANIVIEGMLRNKK